MNNEELKAEINAQRKALQELNLRLGKFLQTCDTLDKSGLPSDHAKALMEECIRLLANDYLGAKARPLVNAIHKACFKNVKSTLEQSRKAEEEELASLMPACYRPKVKGAKAPQETTATQE